MADSGDTQRANAAIVPRLAGTPPARHLADYVRAIHGRPGPLAIVAESQRTRAWQETGFVVEHTETHYCFADQVTIRRTLERDRLPAHADEPAHAHAEACAECWIGYEVIDAGTPLTPIEPTRITFASACRERFWLAYFSADHHQ